jgi:hypothetical protein
MSEIKLDSLKSKLEAAQSPPAKPGEGEVSSAFWPLLWVLIPFALVLVYGLTHS